MSSPALWIASVTWSALGVAVVVAAIRGQLADRDFSWRVFATSVAVAAVFFALALALPAVEGDPLLEAAWVRWIGAGLCVVGLSWTFWTYTELGHDFSAEPTVKTQHALHTGGPYRTSRHPAYSGILLMVLGAALGVGYLMLGATAALGAFLIARGQAAREELAMQMRYGEEYVEYARTVGRFTPRWPRRKTRGR